MKTGAWILAGLLVLAGGSAAWACGDYGGDPFQVPLENLLSGDEKRAEPAATYFRSLGPAGLERLMEEYHRLKNAPAGNASAAIRRGRLEAGIDRVAAQKDAWASGLFWHTDLEEAKRAASSQGRPILSLRLLGRLDEEYSCANSRFFRTLLYADPAVASFMKDHYVLHWQSVRPVPRMSIDFGDGRRMECTITGNSIHYVLDSQGRVLDALPGLAHSRVFLQNLSQAALNAKAILFPRLPASRISTGDFKGRTDELYRRWQNDLIRVGVLGVENAPAARANAATASRRAATKRVVEMPVLAALGQEEIEALESRTEADVWRKIAALHQPEIELDDPVLQLLRRKHLSESESAGPQADKILSAMVEQLKESLARDTVRNEYQFRTKILVWLARSPETPVDELNQRVYAELFLTPLNDPWMGLTDPGVFTALPARGLVER